MLDTKYLLISCSLSYEYNPIKIPHFEISDPELLTKRTITRCLRVVISYYNLDHINRKEFKVYVDIIYNMRLMGLISINRCLKQLGEKIPKELKL